jgi:hypothetical protein
LLPVHLIRDHHVAVAGVIDVQRLHEIRRVGHNRLVHAIEPHLYGPRLHARAVQHILEPDADPASVTHSPVRPFAACDTGLEEAARIARTLIDGRQLDARQGQDLLERER